MGFNFDKVIVGGNVTRDPELRYTPNGNAMANFSLAVNRVYKQDGVKKEEVYFFDIVVFGKQAENCGQYVTKGKPVLIEGHLQQRRWESEGQKRSKVEIVAQNIKFLPDGKNGQAVGDTGTPPVDENDNEIPF